MNKGRVARLHRRLRLRAGLTQQALSERCGVPRWKIGRLEADAIERLRFDEVDRCLTALGAELELLARYRGAAADRLVDELHARLAAHVARLLTRLGWTVRVEVTFSEYGERGSYDILAWHAGARALLVVEVKSELASIEATLRPLDVKLRLGPSIARKRFGWDVRRVGAVLVLPEDGSARRAVRRHKAILRPSLPATSRELRRWLGAPDQAIAGIWFVSAPAGQAWGRNPSSVERVRARRADAHAKGQAPVTTRQM